MKVRKTKHVLGSVEKVCDIGIRFRLGTVEADSINGNSKETRIEVKTRICTRMTEDDKW